MTIIEQKPFRAVIAGDSIADLRKNMQIYLSALSAETASASPASQATVDDDDDNEAAVDQVLENAQQVAAGPTRTQTVIEAAELLEFGVDSKGLPWDARIHSVSQGKNKDGSWRLRRGVEDSLVTKIEQELIGKVKETQGQIMVPAIPHVAAAEAPHTPPTLAVVPALPPSAPVTPAPTMAAPPATPPPVTFAHSVDTFRAQLIPTLAELVKQGKLNNEYIQSLKAHYKVDEIWKLNAEQIGEMFNMFCTHGLLTKVG